MTQAPLAVKKMSGMGRELGAEGLDTFRHTKLVMIDPEAAPQDFWWFPYADAEQYGGEVADSNGHSNGHANGHANGHSNG